VRSRLLKSWLARAVLIANLRHDDKPVHRAEGYGGEAIEAFPPFRFFALREAGQAQQAETEYRTWYRAQFDKYMHLEKSVGGMKNGSLYRMVVALHNHAQAPLSGQRPAFRHDLIDRAIQLRVAERFQLLSSIKHGYVRSINHPVVGVARGGHVYLSSGHHRAAALWAIQKQALPSVLVLSPTARYMFRQLKIG
jgi:hypothetical protein